MIRKLFVLFSLSFIFLFSGCVSLHNTVLSAEEESLLYPIETYVPEKFDWQEVCPGISRCDFKNPEFPIIYHAVKIDLTLAGLELVCFPDRDFTLQESRIENESITQPFIFKGMRTSKFAELYNCTVAVNLSPFGGKNGTWNLAAKLGSKRQIVGLHVADGLVVSAPVKRYAAIAFKRETGVDGELFWRASIEKNQTEETAAASDYAFGGFYIVLENGKVAEKFVRNHDSRTGLGISEDGCTLYILVVEGEVLSQSEGLSYPQCGEIFKAMGCENALEVDGGGSSDLCINGKSLLSYKVNRIQGNSLGFFVEGLK